MQLVTYEVNGYKILPIYHPSPISPKSYKGNVPIFEKLRDLQQFVELFDIMNLDLKGQYRL